MPDSPALWQTTSPSFSRRDRANRDVRARTRERSRGTASRRRRVAASVGLVRRRRRLAWHARSTAGSVGSPSSGCRSILDRDSGHRRGMGGPRRDHDRSARHHGRAATEDEALALVVVASQLHFLFAADEDWTIRTLCRSSIGPATSTALSRRGTGICRGVGERQAARGRPQRRVRAVVLQAGHHIRRVESVGGSANSSLASPSAARSPRIGIEMATGLVSAADDASRASFASAMASVLGRAPRPEVAVARWDAWIKDYLADRVAGVPRPLSADEATEAVGWLLDIGDRFPDAVALVAEIPAGLDVHTRN